MMFFFLQIGELARPCTPLMDDPNRNTQPGDNGGEQAANHHMPVSISAPASQWSSFDYSLPYENVSLIIDIYSCVM